MKVVQLSEDGETVQVVTPEGPFYLSLHEEGGVRVITESPMTVRPLIDNSIRIDWKLTAQVRRFIKQEETNHVKS